MLDCWKVWLWAALNTWWMYTAAIGVAWQRPVCGTAEVLQLWQWPSALPFDPSLPLYKSPEILWGGGYDQASSLAYNVETMVLEAGVSCFGHVDRCRNLLEKWNPHKASQQEKSALKSHGRFCADPGPNKTPAPQTVTDCGNIATPLVQEPWVPNNMLNTFWSENSPVFLSLTHVWILSLLLCNNFFMFYLSHAVLSVEVFAQLSGNQESSSRLCGSAHLCGALVK